MDWLGLSFVDTLHGLIDEMLGFCSGMAEIRFGFWVDQEDLRHRLAIRHCPISSTSFLFFFFFLFSLRNVIDSLLAETKNINYNISHALN
jgi:hypothetical protein